MEILGFRRIKKVDLLLRTMQMMKNKHYADEEIIEKLLLFEKTMNNLYHSNKDIAKIFNIMASNEVRNSTLFDLPYLTEKDKNHFTKNLHVGGSLFACAPCECSILEMPYSFTPIEDLIDDDTFDLSRIGELVKLFDTLVDFGITEARIGNNEIMKSINNGYSIEDITGSFATKVPGSFQFESFKHGDCAEICKTFSDSKITYEEYEEGCYCNDEEKEYKAHFEQSPNWVISGCVIYYEDKKLYLGGSSPHTEFRFYSTTLYPDISKFPSKDELYLPSQVEMKIKSKTLTNN